jgi:hypothetical protein
MKTKITKKRDFSLRMMRWRYFIKAGNPTEKDLENYNSVIKAILFVYFSRYSTQFKKVGYDIDDVLSLLKIHTISFVGAFALENSKEKMESFRKRFLKINGRFPDESDILKKNQSDCYYFLKQRISENASVAALYGKKMHSNSESMSEEERYSLSQDPQKTPEEIVILIEEEAFLNKCAKTMDEMPLKEKKALLNNFIEKNKNNDKMKKEVKLAIKKIKDLNQQMG